MDDFMKFVILQEERLILEYVRGKATWTGYMEMKKEQVASPLYDGTFDVITDIRDVHTEFSLKIEKEITNYVKYLGSQKFELKHRTSVITNTPKQLLHAEFFKMSGNKLPILTKTVSTYQSAFDYIHLDKSKHQKILNLFEEMKAS